MRLIQNNTKEFQAEMKRLVDVIHGNAIVDPRTGHASGVYERRYFTICDWLDYRD